jgi:hypothetical protein
MSERTADMRRQVYGMHGHCTENMGYCKQGRVAATKKQAFPKDAKQHVYKRVLPKLLLRHREVLTDLVQKFNR